MAKLTPLETVNDNLFQSLDVRNMSHMYACAAYALGQDYESNKIYSRGSTGELPNFPDINPEFHEIGQSRNILTNAALMLMKTGYMDPEPDFPDLDKWDEEIRKAFVRSVWTNQDMVPGMDEIGAHVHRAFMDGDGLGVGWVQIGTKEGRVTVRHHYPWHVIWDRHVHTTGNARFVAFVHKMPVEEAVNLFGSRVKDKATEDFEQGRSMYPTKSVKIIEYYDLGYGKWEPTCCWFLNYIGGEVLEREENKFDCIPAAHYEHMYFPATRRPTGRYELQMSNQALRNGIERYMRLTLERGSGFDVFDFSKLAPESLKDLLDGQVLPAVGVEGGTDNVSGVVQRYPAQDIPAGALQLLSLVDRQQNVESGNSDADRANLSKDSRTLGELELVQGGSDIQTAWSKRQYAKFLQRLIGKFVYISREHYTAPITLPITGTPVIFNNPKEMTSDIAQHLQDPSRVVVQEDRLQFEDKGVKAKNALAIWGQFLQDPYTNPIELRRLLFEMMGQKEPDKLIMQPMAPAGDPSQMTQQATV